MRSVIRFLVGALLALGMVTGAAAATQDGKTPASASPLSSIGNAEITGSFAGGFAYYTVNYPGDGSNGVLTLNYSPHDPSTANAVGVNVYQDGNLISTANGIGATPGTSSLVFSSTKAGPILVQVYNYADGTPVSFTVDLTGVTATAPAPAPRLALASPPAAASPTGPPAAPIAASGESMTSANPMPLTKPTSGTLPGNVAGLYQYYSVPYPGDGSTRTITLTFTPTDFDTANALFVNVYQDGNLLVTGRGTSATTPGDLTFFYSSTSASPILVQIANYNSDTTISYTISD